MDHSIPKPELAPDKPAERQPFWTVPKKIVGLLVGAILFIGIAKSCGGTHQPIAARLDAQPSNPPLTGEEARELTKLRQQLEQGHKAAANQLEGAGDVQAPTMADLTAQQQRAAVEAGYGPQPWGANWMNRRGNSGTAAKPESKETTTVVSYRTEETAKTTATLKGEKEEDSTATDPAPAIEPDKLASATGPKYRIRQGTLLPCTEMLRINGALAGHINCLISFPIFSTTGNHLLMPAGTVALGKIEKVGSQGQERLYVAFQTLIMPDGFTVRMSDAADGLDQIGQTGLRDKVNRHFGQVFGAGVALALVGGLAQIGNNIGSYSAASQYRVGVTESMSQNAMQVLQRFANVLPTFVIREGARNNLYLPGDLYLEDYRAHTMQGDM